MKIVVSVLYEHILHLTEVVSAHVLRQLVNRRELCPTHLIGLIDNKYENLMIIA